MAVVQVALTSNFSRTPYIKPPDLAREYSAMPRSLVYFTRLNAAIAAKPVNDQQELTISIVLPVTFAYRLLALNIYFTQDVAFSWTRRGYFEVANGVRGLEGGATQRWALELEAVDRIPTLVEANIVRFPSDVMPTDILQARNGIAPSITVKLSNKTDPAAVNGILSCMISFLEYDIEQAQRFPVHWPTLVYDR